MVLLQFFCSTQTEACLNVVNQKFRKYLSINIKMDSKVGGDVRDRTAVLK